MQSAQVEQCGARQGVDHEIQVASIPVGAVNH